MPRLRIIILERPDRDDPNTYNYVFWADVPIERQPFYAQAGKLSVWKDALTADSAAIAAGEVVERQGTIKVPSGATVGQIQGYLEARHAAFQADITNNNQWNRYSTTWDGTTWVPGGID